MPADPFFNFHSYSSFLTLKQSLSDGTYAQLFPVGYVFNDTWTDHDSGISWSADLMVVDYRMVLFPDGTKRLTATLLRIYACPVPVQFDAPEKPGNRRAFTTDLDGWNCYPLSNIHQFLNSQGRPGEWFQPTHEFDNPPDIANSEYGYLTGCSDNLLKIISPVDISSLQHDIPVGDLSCNTKPAYFYLPSLEQMNFNFYDDPDIKSKVWQYFDSPYPSEYPYYCRDTTYDLWLSSNCYSGFIHFIHGESDTIRQALPCCKLYVAPACTVVADA